MLWEHTDLHVSLLGELEAPALGQILYGHIFEQWITLKSNTVYRIIFEKTKPSVRNPFQVVESVPRCVLSKSSAVTGPDGEGQSG